MITKAQIKHIQSLSDKKYRYQHRQFVVEGEKMVREALSEASCPMIQVIASEEWLTKNTIDVQGAPVISAKSFELEKMSSLHTSPKVMAVLSFPEEEEIQIQKPIIMLDDIQDPGNMGTILRIADWFGVRHVLCSLNTVDCFNSKAIQSSMGSIFRSRVHYCHLSQWLKQHASLTVYATTLQGRNLKKEKSIQNGVILFGNESKGISSELLSLVHHELTIPGQGEAESLNVAVAAGIVCFHLLS